jgi:phosphoglycerate dehydrogenase-like enzyme
MALPVITVLLAEGEDSLPGLEGLEGQAEIREARYPDEIKAALPETDILLVTDFRVDVLEDVWPADCPIKWIHATSAGVDALMIPPIRDSEIPVTNARGIFDRGIAEYVLGAVLMFAKDTLGNLALQRQHQWQHRETALVRGARALVVGAGSIGAEVATLLNAMGMQVEGTARTARDEPPFSKVHAQDRLPELLPEADYVVITAPLTEQTRHLFDADLFERMKPGARLINVGRGPIVKTDDLVQALQDKRIAGAALDVFEEEPLAENSPLWDMNNVMISAHMAGDFIGWRRALGEQFVKNFQRWQSGEALDNTVDKKRGYVSKTD